MAIIDRDPEEMMKFAQQAKSHVSAMQLLISGLRKAATSHQSDLDDNCSRCIDKLNRDCDLFLTQVNVYTDLAADIEKKARRQMEIDSKF